MVWSGPLLLWFPVPQDWSVKTVFQRKNDGPFHRNSSSGSTRKINLFKNDKKILNLVRSKERHNFSRKVALTHLVIVMPDFLSTFFCWNFLFSHLLFILYVETRSRSHLPLKSFWLIDFYRLLDIGISIT